MDAIKVSQLWANWTATGHTEQQLVNFITRLKMKHVEDERVPVAPVAPAMSPRTTTVAGAAYIQEGGGSSGGGGGVRAFEPEVVKQLSQVCGQVRNSPKKSLPSLCIVSVKCLSLSLGQHVTRSSGAT